MAHFLSEKSFFGNYYVLAFFFYPPKGNFLYPFPPLQKEEKTEKKKAEKEENPEEKEEKKEK